MGVFWFIHHLDDTLTSLLSTENKFVITINGIGVREDSFDCGHCIRNGSQKFNHENFKYKTFYRTGSWAHLPDRHRLPFVLASSFIQFFYYCCLLLLLLLSQIHIFRSMFSYTLFFPFNSLKSIWRNKVIYTSFSVQNLFFTKFVCLYNVYFSFCNANFLPFSVYIFCYVFLPSVLFSYLNLKFFFALTKIKEHNDALKWKKRDSCLLNENLYSWSQHISNMQVATVTWN